MKNDLVQQEIDALKSSAHGALMRMLKRCCINENPDYGDLETAFTAIIAHANLATKANE